MNDKFKSAVSAARKSAKRELGIFVAVMIFGLMVAVVAMPIIFLMSLLPDWAWFVVFAVGVFWMVLGETISETVRAYRGDQP